MSLGSPAGLLSSALQNTKGPKSRQDIYKCSPLAAGAVMDACFSGCCLFNRVSLGCFTRAQGTTAAGCRDGAGSGPGPSLGLGGFLPKTAHLTALGPLAAFILGHLLRSYEGQRMKTSECPFNSDPALRGFDREAACGMRRFCAREFPVRLDHGGSWSVLTSPDPLLCPPFGPTELQSDRGEGRVLLER